MRLCAAFGFYTQQFVHSEALCSQLALSFWEAIKSYFTGIHVICLRHVICQTGPLVMEGFQFLVINIHHTIVRLTYSSKYDNNSLFFVSLLNIPLCQPGTTDGHFFNLTYLSGKEPIESVWRREEKLWRWLRTLDRGNYLSITFKRIEQTVIASFARTLQFEAFFWCERRHVTAMPETSFPLTNAFTFVICLVLWVRKCNPLLIKLLI